MTVVESGPTPTDADRGSAQARIAVPGGTTRAGGHTTTDRSTTVTVPAGGDLVTALWHLTDLLERIALWELEDRESGSGPHDPLGLRWPLTHACALAASSRLLRALDGADRTPAHGTTHARALPRPWPVDTCPTGWRHDADVVSAAVEALADPATGLHADITELIDLPRRWVRGTDGRRRTTTARLTEPGEPTTPPIRAVDHDGRCR